VINSYASEELQTVVNEPIYNGNSYSIVINRLHDTAVIMIYKRIDSYEHGYLIKRCGKGYTF